VEISNVGVVGCGLMGSGIAQVCAQSGYQVIISEINDELLNKGLTSISNHLARSVEKGKLTLENKEAVLSRIKGTTNINDFTDCDLVIEAVIENMDLKKEIFAELDSICHAHCILATNTSCLSITDISRLTRRPDKVLGLHFFNPAPVMKLVEIVRTIATGSDTLEIAKDFARSLGKTIVIAPDTPGFIVNRLQLPFRLEAIRMVENGIATKEDIDTAVRLGLGYPMGPLELQDVVGLDTTLAVVQAIYEETKDLKFAPPTLLKKMVAAGWLGCKVGRGFYEWDSQGQKET